MPKKVADLTGAELDYWVAKAKGDYQQVTPNMITHYDFPAYSTDWEYGGPIIDREKISINQDLDATCDAECRAFAHMPDNVWQGCFGATALEAAMRCFVDSRFGDEVE